MMRCAAGPLPADEKLMLPALAHPNAKNSYRVLTLLLSPTTITLNVCAIMPTDAKSARWQMSHSMNEFKQIVGRGTRVHEDTRKYYFMVGRLDTSSCLKSPL